MSEKETEHTPTPNPQAATTTEVVVDDSNTLPSYSNFCRVTATPEEVILDFGLNPSRSRPAARTSRRTSGS